ncbi:YheC/YheD family protein [Bacillus horti]|uniref:ATP-grasp domain-containing protein n=1 Tax=Caldalkalibacillus horti TaxID=77523 RepID=A0ABT9W325_9BACI|nr:YheC/YheD family protein [Bacillus horti]MDQ0167653.1 hypothetical protein [Bacillus horti]
MKSKVRSRSITGKLRVHQYLKSDTAIKPYLPKAVSYSLPNLRSMTQQFESVYVKPNVGSLGKGIFRVQRKSDNYELKSSKNVHKYFSTINQVHRYINSQSKKKLFIQQGIDLGKANGQPFDIRSMVQRKPGGPWTFTGMVAKIGKVNKIVTNHYQGGKPVLMDQLYDRLNLMEEGREKASKDIKDLSLKIAHTLNAKHPGMYQMGIDLAREANGKLWILEVNSRHPQFYAFKRMDRKMYNRMFSFAKSIGRYKP